MRGRFYAGGRRSPGPPPIGRRLGRLAEVVAEGGGARPQAFACSENFPFFRYNPHAKKIAVVARSAAVHLAQVPGTGGSNPGLALFFSRALRLWRGQGIGSRFSTFVHPPPPSPAPQRIENGTVWDRTGSTRNLEPQCSSQGPGNPHFLGPTPTSPPRPALEGGAVAVSETQQVDTDATQTVRVSDTCVLVPRGAVNHDGAPFQAKMLGISCPFGIRFARPPPFFRGRLPLLPQTAAVCPPSPSNRIATARTATATAAPPPPPPLPHGWPCPLPMRRPRGGEGLGRRPAFH